LVQVPENSVRVPGFRFQIVLNTPTSTHGSKKISFSSNFNQCWQKKISQKFFRKIYFCKFFLKNICFANFFLKKYSFFAKRSFSKNIFFEYFFHNFFETFFQKIFFRTFFYKFLFRNFFLEKTCFWNFFQKIFLKKFQKKFSKNLFSEKKVLKTKIFSEKSSTHFNQSQPTLTHFTK